MGNCEECGERIEGMPFRCKYCKNNFCDIHRLPEDHHCGGINRKNVFHKLEKKETKNNYTFFKEKSQKREHEEYIETYNPHKRNKSHYSRPSMSGLSLNFLNFKIPYDIKDNFVNFLIAVAIGLFFNYIYYQTLSLKYLFIYGVSEWFAVLQQTINYGIYLDYNLFYLVINGLFYFYLYSMTIGFIISIIKNMDDSDTWKMIAWILVLAYLASRWLLPLL